MKGWLEMESSWGNASERGEGFSDTNLAVLFQQRKRKAVRES